eukprot:5349866-Alexandrium_andersonii.AAC.1
MAYAPRGCLPASEADTRDAQAADDPDDRWSSHEAYSSTVTAREWQADPEDYERAAAPAARG